MEKRSTPSKLVLNLGGQSFQVLASPIPPSEEESLPKLKLSFGYSKKVLEEVKSLSGAKFDPEDKSWTVDDNERNYYAFTQWVQVHDPRYDDPIPEGAPSLKGLPENLRPMEHQGSLIKETLHRKRIIGAHEMGLGKTLSGLILGKQISGQIMVVAPTNPMRTWLAEQDKWGLRFPLYDPATPSVTGMKMLTPQRLNWFVNNVEPRYWPDHLFVDECHNFKNPESQQTQALMELASVVRAKDGLILLLSGTTQPKDPSDWWSYCEILQPGFLRESSKSKLARRLASYQLMTNKKGTLYPQFVQWNQEEVLKMHDRLGNMLHVRLKKNCTDLPPKTYVRRIIPVDAVQMSVVQTIIETAKSGLDALEKLRQLSDGFSYKNDTAFRSPKLDDLQDFLEDFPDNRLVVYAGYTRSIDMLMEFFEQRKWRVIKLDGRGMVAPREYQRGTDPLAVFANKEKHPEDIVYIGHPQSGGVGLNLQASQYIYFYSNDFKGANRAQAEDRIHRLGMGASATIVDVLWLPSDYRVLDNLLVKHDLQDISLGEIKDWAQAKNLPKE